MNDLDFGTRDKRGNWAPRDALETAPVFVFPPRPLAFLKWLPSYFFPWNVLWMLSALAWWYLVIPPREVLAVLQWGWVLKLFAVNCLAVFLFYGAFELQLYIRRAQGNRFKYNPKFPADHKSPAFLFKRQNVDSLIRGFGTGVPIWTAFEVLVLHAQAAGHVPWVGFSDNPWYLAGLALLLPVIHEAHFFVIHRLIHIPVLYRWVHSVHHNSVNPSPWSSLSMHPVEHLLYFATAAYHLVIPSNPVLVMYQLHMAGFGAVVGHVGFDKVEVTDETAIDSHAYAHYLHHKYFEVNYGDGLIPFDRWFGTWHDGTRKGEEEMQARYERRKARANAR
ncbi:sterol desaturase family protein [Gellertiella hungarica]|uniref:Sterol desaturase/sphingolipid hydroxylase (Fatty acid hydroxylase superfamily) n=1 Tax=Gellertiella hungarica TaxID=1572859 RepID=A0A7W6NLS1_9HYPH|nr:sterol desaturase family protein [Gellertiella hungarica]MBB4065632.1 sterol desaturase/sphingolipid hydroxylase (fatty acid hydroxylase superfamily) [Gellertiella hungarica]